LYCSPTWRRGSYSGQRVARRCSSQTIQSTVYASSSCSCRAVPDLPRPRSSPPDRQTPLQPAQPGRHGAVSLLRHGRRQVTLNVPNSDEFSGFMNVRVADVQACYELWKSRGPSSSRRRSPRPARSVAICVTRMAILSRLGRVMNLPVRILRCLVRQVGRGQECYFIMFFIGLHQFFWKFEQFFSSRTVQFEFNRTDLGLIRSVALWWPFRN
jgi:hypothetical protein